MEAYKKEFIDVIAFEWKESVIKRLKKSGKSCN